MVATMAQISKISNISKLEMLVQIEAERKALANRKMDLDKKMSFAYTSEGYMQRNPCILDRISKKLNHSPWVFYIFVSFCMLFASYLHVGYLQEFMEASVLHRYGFLAMIVYDLFLYFLLCVTRASYHDIDNNSKNAIVDTSVEANENSREHDALLGTHSEDLCTVTSVTVCSLCNIQRVARCHHCSVCQQCVHMRDHHCPWIGKCVGQRNVHNFFLFLFTSCVLSGYACVYLFLFWSSAVSTKHQPSASLLISSSVSGSSSIISQYIFYFAFLFIFEVFVVSGTGYLLYRQCYLIVNNKTGLQLMSSASASNHSKTNAFDTGSIYYNIIYFLDECCQDNLHPTSIVVKGKVVALPLQTGGRRSDFWHCLRRVSVAMVCPSLNAFIFDLVNVLHNNASNTSNKKQ